MLYICVCVCVVLHIYTCIYISLYMLDITPQLLSLIFQCYFIYSRAQYRSSLALDISAFIPGDSRGEWKRHVWYFCLISISLYCSEWRSLKIVCTTEICNYVSICIFYFSLFLQPWKTKSWFSHENVKNPLKKKKGYILLH